MNWVFSRIPIVMAGLVPAIHGFAATSEDVDGRHEGGHDGKRK